MPSVLHQAIVELYRQSLRLAIASLEWMQVPVPPNATWRTDDADLSTPKPVDRHADLLLLAIVKGRPALAIAVEVQLKRNRSKRLAWACYAVLARVRHRCPAAVLVISPDAGVARWARTPVEIGPGLAYAPLVVGPREIPAVTTLTAARRHVELAVLSALAHTQAPITKAKPIVKAALAACAELRTDDKLVYSDVILRALGPALKEAVMQLPRGYKFQTEYVRQWAADRAKSMAEGRAAGLAAGRAEGIAAGKAEGRAEGKAEGRAEGKALGRREGAFAVIERLLRAKFGAIPRTAMQRLKGATVEELEHWALQVLTADSLASVLGSRVKVNGSKSELVLGKPAKVVGAPRRARNGRAAATARSASAGKMRATHSSASPSGSRSKPSGTSAGRHRRVG
ncbi:MAG TPA: DUF4351 domain-containing protein [Polyangiaceae bacterium]